MKHKILFIILLQAQILHAFDNEQIRNMCAVGCVFTGVVPLFFGLARVIYYAEECPTPSNEFSSWCAEGLEPAIIPTVIGGCMTMTACCLSNIGHQCLKALQKLCCRNRPDDDEEKEGNANLETDETLSEI